jgi:3-methyl-2-oxobutanoate hydroxymethyltransferase
VAISQRLRVPIIGIGAGGGCDGQVLVLHDLLGLYDRFTPRFAKRYAELFAEMELALIAYREEVAAHRFPAAEHVFSLDESAWTEWQETLSRM